MRRFFLVVISGIFLIDSCDQNEFPPLVNCSESGLTLTLDTVSMASGCSIFDGSIHVKAIGGEEPYTFSLNDTEQISGDFIGIQAGIYVVSVTDANGCQAFVNNINIEAEGFAVSTELKPDSLCLGGNGAAAIVVTGSNEPYTYQLGAGGFTENNVFTGLNEGKHKITVKDGLDCTVELTITVPHGFSGTSWSADVRPIIVESCALSGCHNGITRPDFRIYEKAKKYTALIREYTQSGAMPFDGTLTQQEIDVIACWVDDGAPNN